MTIHPQKPQTKRPYLLAVLPMVAVALIALVMAYNSYRTPVRASSGRETPFIIQEGCPSHGTVNQEMIAEYEYRAYEEGYLAALTDMVGAVQELSYNPAYVAPERKPR